MRTEDGQIISKCLNGDKAAFGFLVDKYKASVYALAYYRLRNFEDAEDITQEVFVEAYQRLHTLKRWDSFSVWLYSITSNMCKEFLRSKSRRRDREFIADQKINIMRSKSLNSYHENKVYESLREALDNLPDIYQQVLTLYYLGGMNSEEIAQALGISSTTIRQRISRARSQLREEILAMMGETFEQKKLSVSFTFRIVEAIKQVRVQPLSPKALPWGMSLATGIIITFLSLGQHFNIINPIGMMKGSPLPGITKVLKVGEIPVDVVNISDAPIISSQRWDGNGLGNVLPNLQNALFMSPQAEDGTWTKMADMPTARDEFSTSAVNGKIYAIGGSGNNGQISTVEEYDPVKDEWIKKTDMPAARCNESTCAVNGKIYAFGGWRNGGAIELSTTEEYDPEKDEWIEKANMPTERQFFSANAVNGMIYAIGGWRGGQAISTVEEYDPVKDRWTKKADMPTTRYGHSAEVVNGKVYVIGGCPIGMVGNQWFGNGGVLSLVEEYDPISNRWTKMADMPTGRMWQSSSVVNGKIYVIGGVDLNKEEILSAVEEYDPLTDKWTKKANIPTARARLCCDTVNGKIYAIGGVGFGIVFSTVEEYDPGISGQGINFKGKLPNTWGDVRMAIKK
jgi:RNA polymerase sigma factor (sigma-70 family)